MSIFRSICILICLSLFSYQLLAAAVVLPPKEGELPLLVVKEFGAGGSGLLQEWRVYENGVYSYRNLQGLNIRYQMGSNPEDFLEIAEAAEQGSVARGSAILTIEWKQKPGETRRRVFYAVKPSPYEDLLQEMLERYPAEALKLP